MSHNSSLEPILRAVEPAVRLVPERYLRQVLHYLIDWGHPVPTNLNLPYWVSREDLVAGRLLPERFLAGTEPRLLLITDPDDRLVDQLPQALQLQTYWRVLFRAAVMKEIDRKLEAGSLTEESCLDRLERFGLASAREIRSVLIDEHLVVPTANATLRYRAFAATYLDLDAFERHATAYYFPSLPTGDSVRRMLLADFATDQLLAATLPLGAADIAPEPAQNEHFEQPESDEEPAPSTDVPTGSFRQAQEAEEKGNHVRAAILHTQRAARASGPEREAALRNADAVLLKLTNVLGVVFAWDHETRRNWHLALGSLLEPAARGFWPRAARCLYELQTIPADLSRDVFAIDLPESIRTFGRRPVKRPLPHARPVLLLMCLKRAHTQMLRSGHPSGSRQRLNRLFQDQIHAIEHGIRHDFTPIITTALKTAGLTPLSAVEEVARDKLVAELLDRICERGYLRIGDLRDAVARNRLKMNDLSGPGEFLRGDALLRADLALAYALDGVYRKGEFYLRWIQRSISVFFATPLGRLFTLYIALPFGGAFMALMFLEELRHMGGKLVSLANRPSATARAMAPPPHSDNSAASATPAPDIVEPDELDIDEDGQPVWVNLKPGTVTSDQVGVDEEGNPFLLATPPGAALVTDVFTSSAPTVPHPDHPPASNLIAWPTIVGFGIFLLLMFHVPPFRRLVFKFLGYLWWVVRGAVWDIPVGIWRSHTVRGVRHSRPVQFLSHHFWSPLLITLILFGTLLLARVSPWFLLKWGTWIWAGLTLAYNTPWGWVIQDRIAEAVSDWWRVVRVNLLPGLVATIIDWFTMLANWVERQLYAVDEWLRFRGGDSQSSLAMKALLGLLWFPIAYIFRFVFYLLVEPQVNPVKHFPVVTVSHKVIWPMVPQIAEMTQVSVVTVSMFVNGIPGIFGFIAWELKENWRLYRANRPRRLKPVIIGSHGETMRGMLRPGFHSGTIPKLFRKLRHASHAKVSWLLHDLEHATEGVRRFAERELVDLLARSPEWGALGLEVSVIRFGCQRLVLDLTVSELGIEPVSLAIENIAGVIEAAIEQPGWTDKLTESQRTAFVVALRGFLDMAAVGRINGRERTESPVPLGPGLADLDRHVTWAEWVERWTLTSGTNGDRGSNPHRPSLITSP